MAATTQKFLMTLRFELSGASQKEETTITVGAWQASRDGHVVVCNMVAGDTSE